MAKRITCTVYDRTDPTTLLGTLSEDSGRTWQHVLSGEGSGGVTVPNLGADAALLDCEAIVRFALDGTDRFAFLAQKRNHHTIAAKQAQQELAVTGPGILALLQHAAIYPEMTIGTGPGRSLATERFFNFVSKDFDDSAWTAATEIKLQSASTGQWDGAPAAFPDPAAYWIWGQAQGVGSPPQPVGDCYFRNDFAVADETDAAFFISADDGYELWLDGERVASRTEAFGWARFERFDVFLLAGAHQLAIRGINIDRPSAAATNVAGVIMTLYETSEGGRTLGVSPIIHTDDTWLCVAYPVDPPSMTPGLILRVLLQGAQARGAVPGITWDFTDTLDSAGNAWNRVDMSFGIGRSVLELVHALAEYLIDVSMDPDLTLHAWNFGTMGTDLSGSVSLDATVLSDATHDGECPLLTVGLIKMPDGHWLEVQNTTSIGQHGWQEGYLELGTAPSPVQAARILQRAFYSYGHENDEVTATIEPKAGATPYVDFAPVGDTVDLLANDRATLLATRLETLRVTEDRGGNPIFVTTAAQVAETTGS